MPSVPQRSRSARTRRLEVCAPRAAARARILGDGATERRSVPFGPGSRETARLRAVWRPRDSPSFQVQVADTASPGPASRWTGSDFGSRRRGGWGADAGRRHTPPRPAFTMRRPWPGPGLCRVQYGPDSAVLLNPSAAAPRGRAGSRHRSRRVRTARRGGICGLRVSSAQRHGPGTSGLGMKRAWAAGH
jgi:hypothetical protein